MLNHPNIVTIYEIDDYKKRIYIAMEYVDGNLLRDKITKDRIPIKYIINH